MASYLAVSNVARIRDVAVAERHDYWRDVVARAVMPMEVHFAKEVPPSISQVATTMVGPVRLTQVREGPSSAFRTLRNIRQSDPEIYQLVLQVQGETVAEQDGRSAVLRSGDFAVSDSSRPFACVHTTCRLVCANFPRALVPLRQNEVARLTGIRFGGDRGSSALVSALLGQLPSALADRASGDSCNGDGGERGRLGTAVVDLVTVALAERLDRGAAVPPDSTQRVLLLRIQAYITARLGDPSLSPTTIAAAHHISSRYLHRLFELTGTSAASWIRARRLERCRRDLLDPTLSPRPAYAIGARWGLTNPAHFNRTFRAAYGVPPGEYRLQTVTDAGNAASMRE